MVTDRLRNKESKIKSIEAVLFESDVFVWDKQKGQGRSQSRNSCPQNNNNPKGISKSQRRSMRCFYYQKIDYIKMECKLWKKRTGERKRVMLRKMTKKILQP